MITYLEKLWNKIEGSNSIDILRGEHGGQIPLEEKESRVINLQGKFNKKNLMVMILVGILLIVIAMPTSTTITKEESQMEMGGFLESQTQSLDLDYKSNIEVELEELLAYVDGVGNVNVMITLSSTSEKILEKDKSTSDLDWEEHTIYGTDSYGDNPYVKKEIYPEIAGVLVAAQGGDNPIVIKNITEAIQALFAVDTHKIKIMKMKLDS